MGQLGSSVPTLTKRIRCYIVRAGSRTACHRYAVLHPYSLNALKNATSFIRTTKPLSIDVTSLLLVTRQQLNRNALSKGKKKVKR